MGMLTQWAVHSIQGTVNFYFDVLPIFVLAAVLGWKSGKEYIKSQRDY